MIDTGDNKKHWYLVNCKSKNVSEHNFTWSLDQPYINERVLYRLKDYAIMEVLGDKDDVVITNISYLGYMSEEYFYDI